MKILGIAGSKRINSNSQWMLETFFDLIASHNVHKEILMLRDYEIKYCLGCDKCKDNGGVCVIDDEMHQIYPKLLDADIIVLSTPNYFKNVSALMKNFMDRTNAFVRPNPKLLRNKYAVGFCVGGEELQDTRYCEEALLRYFKGHKMNTLLTINARADEPGEITRDAYLEKSLRKIGKLISMGVKNNMFFDLNNPESNTFEIHFQRNWKSR